MDSRTGPLGARRTSSSNASKGSRRSSEEIPSSPKVLTSFPSFSPPPTVAPKRKKSSKGSRLASGGNHAGRLSSGQTISDSGMLESSPVEDSIKSPKEEASEPSNRKASASISSRTWKGATTLHKTLIASLTRTSASESTQEGVFNEPDWEASDPLEQASSEQIQRVIDRNGGAISSLRQFSKDLAESNGRVAEERNKKLELIERNRTLRDENDYLKAQLEDTQRKYKNVQNLFKRFVRPEQPGQIQIVDSPNGHFILGKFQYLFISCGILGSLSSIFFWIRSTDYYR
jgi:hypothetical protein